MPLTRHHDRIQILDNAKHMYFTRERVPVPEGGALSAEVRMAARGYGTTPGDLYDGDWKDGVKEGEGRITYVGTVPNAPLADALFRWITPSAWTDLPPSVTVTSATAADGRRLRFVHNWSWDGVSVDLPAAVHDVLADTSVSDKLDLGPWDVRVLLELQ